MTQNHSSQSVDRKAPEISIVIPVLDECDTVRQVYQGLRDTFGNDCEIIFVDDGSRDSTREKLAGLLAEDPALRLIAFHRNHGKSEALGAGFRRARGRLVATLDGDLQDDPAELPRLVEKLEQGYDLVVGWRRKRKDDRFKIYGSRIFNNLAGRLGGVRLHDINCGMKVFRRGVLEDLLLTGGFHRFLPLQAHWKGYRVSEQEIEHKHREHGYSKYTRTKGFRGLLDLFVIIFLMRFEGRPGRFFVGLGAVCAAAGFGVSAYIATIRLIDGNIQSKYPLMALGLGLLVFGFQIFTLGLFGELLSYHFRSVRSVEPVVIEYSHPEDSSGESFVVGESPGTGEPGTT